MPLLDKYKTCLQCKARVEPMPPLGRCSRIECMMMQRYDLCGEQTTAKLYDENMKTKTLQCHAFGEVVYNIGNVHQDDLVTAEALLRAPKFESLTFSSDKKIIKDVKRSCKSVSSEH